VPISVAVLPLALKEKSRHQDSDQQLDGHMPARTRIETEQPVEATERTSIEKSTSSRNAEPPRDGTPNPLNLDRDQSLEENPAGTKDTLKDILSNSSEVKTDGQEIEQALYTVSPGNPAIIDSIQVTISAQFDSLAGIDHAEIIATAGDGHIEKHPFFSAGKNFTVKTTDAVLHIDVVDINWTRREVIIRVTHPQDRLANP